MFFVATLPLPLLPAILYWLPESVGFLIRQGHTEKARHLLRRLAPDAGIGGHDVREINENKARGGSVGELFRHWLAVRTLAIWVAFVCSLLMV